MRTLLQTLLLALACAGVYCATTTSNPKSPTHSISAQAAKTFMLADGTEPFPKRIIRQPR